MDRRGFLRMLGLGAAAAVAPTKAYSFLGGILRPRTTIRQFSFAAGEISPQTYQKVALNGYMITMGPPILVIRNIDMSSFVIEADASGFKFARQIT